MRFIIGYMVFLLSFSSSAGVIYVGNGGDGIVFGETVFLLDLIQSGIHKNPWYSSRIDSKWESSVKDLFSEDYPRSLIAAKLTEIAQKDRIVADILFNTMKAYNWSMTSMALTNVPDEDSVNEFNKYEMIQLAIRQNQSIYINYSYWLKMDPKNKAALIFHEAVYASLDSRQYATGARAREIVGYLFKETFKSKTSLELANFLGNSFKTAMNAIIDLENKIDPPNTVNFQNEKMTVTECPVGTLLKGYFVRYGDVIDNIVAQCQDPKTKLIFSSEPFGGPGGSFNMVTQCPEDKFVNGVELYLRKYEGLKVVSDIKINCSDLANQSWQFMESVTGKPFERARSVNCPAGFFARNLRASGTKNIRDLRFQCVRVRL